MSSSSARRSRQRLPTDGHARVERAWRAGHLKTALHVRVCHAVVGYFKRFTRVFPSHAAIAAKARCSISSVQRTLSDAKACGLILWEHRYVLRDGRPHRTTSVFTMPSTYTGQTDRVDCSEYIHTQRYKEQWREITCQVPLPGPLSDALMSLGQRIQQGRLL